MAQLHSEIQAELSKPSLLERVKHKASTEVDQLLNKGHMTYAAKKTYDTLPQDLQTTLPKPLQQKLGSAALPAFHSLLERMEKAAGVMPRLMGAAKNVALGATEAGMHRNEVAGLGVLAVPGLDTLQASARARIAGDKGHNAVEKRRVLGESAHAALDVGGLGLLAAPAAARLKHAFVSSGYGGNKAQNPPGMRGHSIIPAFVSPELEQKTAGAIKRVGELLTGSKAKMLAGKAKEHSDRAVSTIKDRVTPPDAKSTDSLFKHLQQTSGTARKERSAASRIGALASKERGKVQNTRLAVGTAAGASAGLAAGHKKEAGVGVGSGMSASSYSGPLSFGSFKMVSGIPGFNSPELATKPTKQASAFLEEATKLLKEGGMNTATGAMHAAGKLHATQSVGAPKTTAPAGPSIAQVSKPNGFGTPLSGTKKNIL